MEKNNRLFRKATFGGFNKDDVIDYIEKMKLEFFEYRSQVEETIKELNEKIASFESMDYVLQNILNEDQQIKADSPDVEYDYGDDAISYINEATNHLKKVADELCDNLNKFMKKFNETATFAVPVNEAKPNASFEPIEKEKTSGAASISLALDSLLENIQGEKTENIEPKTDETSALELDSLLENIPGEINETVEPKADSSTFVIDSILESLSVEESENKAEEEADAKIKAFLPKYLLDD